jgi:hypothetical protein
MLRTAQEWSDYTGRDVVCEIIGKHVYFNLIDSSRRCEVAEITELMAPLDIEVADGQTVAESRAIIYKSRRPIEEWVRWLELPVTTELESDGEIQYYVYSENTQTCITSLVTEDEDDS